MRVVFTGSPDEVFYPARDRLVAAFDRWARRQRRAVDPFVVEALVEHRWDAGDGILCRWQPADLRAPTTGTTASSPKGTPATRAGPAAAMCERSHRSAHEIAARWSWRRWPTSLTAFSERRPLMPELRGAEHTNPAGTAPIRRR
jgi:hypothetical protein